MKIGSLFSGYGGLDEGVRSVIGGDVAWVSDIDKGACKVLAHRYPDVPNLGDITGIDWSAVDPVDVICGGSPCQDVSHAGARKGMSEGTRSNLWVAMREAIAALRPSLVVWENVGGAYSAAADSELESREGRLGDGSGGPVLRALGRVLGDLASLGYVGGWHGLRAADVGAPHGRLRVFVVAVPADTHREGRGGVGWLKPVRRDTDGPRTSDTNGAGHHGDGGLDLRTAVTMLPTPTARDWKNVGDPEKTAARMAERGQPLSEVVVNALLPTPACNDMGAAYLLASLREHEGRGDQGGSPDSGAEAPQEGVRNVRSDSAAARAPRGSELGERRPGESADSVRFVPPETPLAGRPPCAHGCGDACGGHSGGAWGQYEAAIRGWEVRLGRPAPDPTELGPKGNPRLSAQLTEFMMGLPAGWITDVPGVTRNEALKLAGNGVVPQQCAAALRFLLDVIAREVAA